MGMLDDPALMLRSAPILPPAVHRGARVRFRPSSTFAQDFEVPYGAVGVVTAAYDQDGTKRANVTIEGYGYATGVRADEIEAG